MRGEIEEVWGDDDFLKGSQHLDSQTLPRSNCTQV